MSSYDQQPYLKDGALAQPAAAVDARAVFGQVMGLVAVTVGFFALGAYLGRNLSGTTGLLLFIGVFGCLIGMRFAAQRSERLGRPPPLAVGLLLGMAVGPVVAYYASTNPSIVWQAGGATALFV